MAQRFLSLFAIYDRPKDYPDKYVVRRHRVLLGLKKAWTETDRDCSLADSLEEARLLLPPGLHNLGRTPEDDPAIAEVWV
jgi:hypothetical protein